MSQPLDSIICLLGDVRRAELNKHEENEIKRGIVGAVQATDGQILCTIDGGISKFVEDAIHFNPEIAESLQIYVKLFRGEGGTDYSHGNQDDCGSLNDYLLEKKGINTPVICVVLGGDLPVLKSVTHIVSSVNNTHVIVVKGSGRVADFLSCSYNHETVSSTPSEPEVKTFFGIQMEGKNEADLKALFQQWQLKKNKITLWSPEGEKGLDVVIENSLFTLLQGFNIGVEKQLAIISAWGRYDIAENIISEMSHFPDMNKPVLKKYLMDGLIHNKVEFVRKLMRKYDDFENSLTPRELYEIYKESVEVDKNDRATELFMSLFFPLEVKWPDSEDMFFSEVGYFVEQLLADTHLNPYSEYCENGSCVKHVCSKDLLCWALLFNKCDMAMLFWTRGENYTCVALFASAVLRKLSCQAKDFGDTDLYRSMKDNAMKFERYAIAIVNRIHISRSDISQKLIVSVVEQYGKTTPLYIAGNNNLMDFMEQTVCQSKLTDIWDGNMAWNTSLLKKLGCIFFPFLLLPAIKFKSSGKDCDRKTHPEKMEKSRRYFTLFSSRKENRIGLRDAILSFYGAPAIKFLISLMFYVIYLMIFSVMILTNLHALEDGGVSFLEIVVVFWAGTLILEEIRQVIEEDQPSKRSKVKLWFANTGNKFDVVAYLMLMISIVSRFALPTNLFKWARYSYSITAVVFWWISMRYLFVHRHIGPKVVMIGKMLKDMAFLFMFFVVVVISVGIAYTTNLHPNSLFDWDTIKRIAFYPYWQIHGELSLDYITTAESDPSTCTNNPLLYNNGTLPACPVDFDMVPLIAVVYLTLTNIILLNVLIAMFSYTFQKIQNKAGKVARFHNYFLVYEYSNMPTLVAPLNVINFPYRIALLCTRKRTNEFKISLAEKEKKVMMYYETEALEKSVLGVLIRKESDEAAIK